MEKRPPLDSSDEDSISITSTVPSVHELDESFPVVQILAERRLGHHETEYLVEWEGYDLDRASWEPKRNIQGETLEQWKDTKRRQVAGTETKFDIKRWEARQRQLQADKSDRKKRRKNKRKKLQALQFLGQPIEQTVNSKKPAKKTTKSKAIEVDSSDEALEESYVEHSRRKPVKGTRRKKSSSKRILKKGIARPLSRRSRNESSDEDAQPSASRQSTSRTLSVNVEDFIELAKVPFNQFSKGASQTPSLDVEESIELAMAPSNQSSKGASQTPPDVEESIELAEAPSNQSSKGASQTPPLDVEQSTELAMASSNQSSKGASQTPSLDVEESIELAMAPSNQSSKSASQTPPDFDESIELAEAPSNQSSKSASQTPPDFDESIELAEAPSNQSSKGASLTPPPDAEESTELAMAPSDQSSKSASQTPLDVGQYTGLAKGPLNQSSRQVQRSSSPDEPLAQRQLSDASELSKNTPKAKTTSNQPSVKQRGASFQAPQAPSMTAKDVPKNVFQAQGLPSFKRHGTLLENSIKAKKPKVYSNMRTMYRAEVQGRAMAEKEPNLDVIGGLYNPANPESMQPITRGALRRSLTSNFSEEEHIAQQNKDTDVAELFVSDHDTTLHSGNLPKYHGRGVCFFWDQNQRKPDTTQPCQNGYMCKFLHEYRTGAAVAENPALKDVGLQDSSITSGSKPALSSFITTQPPQYLSPHICFYWDRYERDTQGRYSPCVKGSSCKYLHERKLGVPVALEPPSTRSDSGTNGIALQPQWRENSLFVEGQITDLPQSIVPPWRSKDSVFEDPSARAINVIPKNGSLDQSPALPPPQAQLASQTQNEPRTQSLPQLPSSPRPDWDPSNPSRAICHFWFTSGKCTKGDCCKYFHSDRSDLPIAPSPSKQAQIRQDQKIICSWWERGSCPYSADECRYFHPDINTSESSQENETRFGPPEANDLRSSQETGTVSESLISQRKSVKFAVDDPIAPPSIEKKISDHHYSPLDSNLKTNNEVCPNWSRDGFCRLSSNCLYRHDDSKSRSNNIENRSLPRPVQPSEDVRMSNLPISSHTNRALSMPFAAAQLDEVAPSNIANSLDKIASRSKINLESHKGNQILKTTATSSKEVVFGSEAASSVVVNFGNLTASNDHPWKLAFTSLTKIIFNQLCLSQDFEHRRRAILSAELWQGSLSAVDESHKKVLNQTAYELSSRSSGLLGVFESYSVLVYPARKDEWKFLDGSLEYPADVCLRYFIFNPNIPQVFSAQNPGVPSGVSHRKVLVNKIHGLEFEQLLPLDPRMKGKSYAYKFYFMFPERANKTVEFLASWIRSCEPKSIIYSSSTEGSWDSFTKCRNAGTILVHESVVANLYRVPSLSISFLQDRLGKGYANCVFWRISECTVPYAVFPSLNGFSDHSLVVGQLSATRLFPHGCAFLLTPSLIVAEPEYTLKLLDWFLFDGPKSKFESSASPWKVVTCYDIVSYALNVANAKAREKAKWEAQNRHDPALESHLEMRRLGYKTCEIRFKLYTKLLDALVKDTEQLRFDNDLNSNLEVDPASPIIYAPSSIKPDDEQNLVNWFAGWAMIHLETFKKFVVVGTRENTDRKHCRRLKEAEKKAISSFSSSTNQPRRSTSSNINTQPATTAEAPKSAKETALSVATKYSPAKHLVVGTSIAKAANDANDFLERLREEISPMESTPMELDSNISKATPSGIVTKQNGDRFLPFSLREDKTTRKELRIKPGYEPKEDKEPYRHPNHGSNSISRSTSNSAAPSPTRKTSFCGASCAGAENGHMNPVMDSPITMSDTSESRHQNMNTLQESEAQETGWRMVNIEPTVAWYKALQKEGRGWEHILVTDLETAAVALGAPKP